MHLSNRCYAVTGLGYSTPWFVNAGFVVGDDLTLIVDTGANAAAAQTIHGYACTVKPANPLRVINTEKHFDHIGGNSFFHERGIDIFGHAAIARTSEEFQAEIKEFNSAITNEVRRLHKEASVFFASTSLCNPTHHIDHDATFNLGNCTVQILLTPGHTATNVSVWIPEDSVLFTGDCLIRGYLPNLDAGTPADWQTWLHSIDKIQKLNPALVVPGHGAVASGHDVQIILDTVRNVLFEAIEKGHSPTHALRTPDH
jgi:cyclase